MNAVSHKSLITAVQILIHFANVMTLRVLFLYSLLGLVRSHDVIVQTTSGKIRGEVQQLNDKQFSQFLGVPFAAPPVGNLRFKPPQGYPGWGDSIRDALEWGPACAQDSMATWNDPAFPDRYMIYPYDEDCLHLNVYISGELTDVTKASLPVIVFIHGGGFVLGSHRWQTGPAFVTHGEPVVMVTIQYRLGVLGFLTTGDDVVTGNMGLKDQQFALKWVQENIAEFGGDAKRVTIAGESAGGESILAHMVSPMSAGLFHKASAQSPPAAWIYPTLDKFPNYFKDYAASFDCSGASMEAIDCLREKPWQQLVNGTELTNLLCQRVIDGEFIKDEPRKLWASGRYNDAQLMVGFTGDDGKLLLDYITAVNFNFTTNRSRDKEILRHSMDLLLCMQLSDDKGRCLDDGISRRYGKSLTNSDALNTVIKARYYDSRDDPLEKGRGVLDGTRDTFFMAFALWAANQVAKDGGSAYVYLFEHATELLGLNVPGGVKMRAPHASEMPYQFGFGFTDSDTVKMTTDELALSRSVMQAWTSFTAGEASFLGMDGEKFAWEPYTVESKQVLVFDTDMSSASMRDGHAWQDALDFWLAIDALADWGHLDEAADDRIDGRKEEL